MTEKEKRVSCVCEEVRCITDDVERVVARHAIKPRGLYPIPDGPQQVALTDEASYEEMVQGLGRILWIWAEREIDRNRDSEPVYK